MAPKKMDKRQDAGSSAGRKRKMKKIVPKYNQEDLDNLRKQIFSTQVILDKVMANFGFKDQKSLQKSNKEFCQVVVGHGPTWDKRRIIITKNNAKEIAYWGRRNRTWTSAKVGLLQRVDYRALRDVWGGLEDLWADNKSSSAKSTKMFARYLLQDGLANVAKLKTLKISCNLLCASEKEDLEKLQENVWSKLTHLEITFGHPYRDGSESKSYLESMSTFKWTSLVSLKLDFVDNITRSLLSQNFLNNISILDMNADGYEIADAALWSQMKHIQMPSLTKMTTRLISMNRGTHRDFRVFFDKQVRLTTLHLNMEYLRNEFFEVDDSQDMNYPLKDLQIKFRRWFRIMASAQGQRPQFSPALLSKFKNLEFLSFRGAHRFNYHSTWPPQAAAEDVIDNLPRSLIHLDLARLCSRVTRFTGHNRLLILNQLQARVHSKVPHIQESDIDVNRCTACLNSDWIILLPRVQIHVAY